MHHKDLTRLIFSHTDKLQVHLHSFNNIIVGCHNRVRSSNQFIVPGAMVPLCSRATDITMMWGWTIIIQIDQFLGLGP